MNAADAPAPNGPGDLAGTAPDTTVIQPISGWPTLGLRELWRHRELVLVFASRDVRVRYKQRAVGMGWVILQPLLTMAIFSVLFGRMMKVPSNGVPYPLFALCGLVAWTYFVHGTTKSTIILANNRDLLTKVRFPRLALPFGTLVGGLVDFAIGFGLLVVALAWFGVTPGWNLVTLPLAVGLLLVTTLTSSLWLSATNVRYRDVENALPFFSQLLLFLSPIAYPATMIPDSWRWLYAVNPMSTVISFFRFALLGDDAAVHPAWIVSVIVALLGCWTGILYFRRQEDRFADAV
ncbi:MAG: phosphate ABC transporter permease [Phycisphaerae bacterium]|nr:phosphate ABC transporter permease [Phycisphaerae bacterium]OUX01036.1 MAG: hypothetical protein CBD91_05435 [Phycisphaeraceae bacterium TMED231]